MTVATEPATPFEQRRDRIREEVERQLRANPTIRVGRLLHELPCNIEDEELETALAELEERHRVRREASPHGEWELAVVHLRL